MPNYNAKISNGNRDDVISYILANKSVFRFTVIDVGGSLSGWSSKVIDALIDLNDCVNTIDNNVTHFKCDITHPDSWKDVLAYVDAHGKFDFCICTHTLEDIMNPVYVSEQLAKIAKSGYIAFPSKHRELARFERMPIYRGYMHHRYIFDMSGDTCVAYPKLNFIEHLPDFDVIASLDIDKMDLSFYWKDTVDMVHVNNNYLGKDIDEIAANYSGLFRTIYTQI